MAPPFAEARITVALPIVKGDRTVYTRYGDFLALIFLFAAIILLIIGGILYIVSRASKGR
jgi:hypothetical protein